MPGGQACSGPGWPCSKYLDERFGGIEKQMKQQFDAMEKANDLAADTLAARLQSMNEWRASMSDLTERFASRELMATEMRRLDDAMDSIKEVLAEARGKASQSSVAWAYLIAGIGVLFGVIDLLAGLSK